MARPASELIERVARAIAAADNEDPVIWQQYVRMARAAIEAMHTPTDAMKDAGATEIAHAHAWENQASADVASDAFVAMIAAALDEPDR